ncbi:MAG: zinc-finger domain-containing protein [Alphaproteobacteria bacterium]|nr:zinc-finger domain-containing protein [Alphaproteobacteria bacterium]
MKQYQDVDSKYTTSTTVKCGGEHKDLNHPKIYLHIDSQLNLEPSITCPYCNTKYILKRS